MGIDDARLNEAMPTEMEVQAISMFEVFITMQKAGFTEDQAIKLIAQMIKPNPD